MIQIFIANMKSIHISKNLSLGHILNVMNLGHILHIQDPINMGP